jgi:hypothetical protein
LKSQIQGFQQPENVYEFQDRAGIIKQTVKFPGFEVKGKLLYLFLHFHNIFENFLAHGLEKLMSTGWMARLVAVLADMASSLIRFSTTLTLKLKSYISTILLLIQSQE